MVNPSPAMFGWQPPHVATTLPEMLDAIREFFEKQIDAPAAQGDERRSIELATAALLVEVVRLGGEIKPVEREVVLRAVRGRFGLSASDAEALLRLAEEQSREATDHYQFTSLINQRFSQTQKQQVIELMWQVAYADSELSAYEQHVIRKIADLLYVPHRAYIAAKLRARDAAKRGNGPT
jgi:uncharacterized tellurite resistance protein B-like protein